MKKYLFYIFAIMMAHPVMAIQITGKVVDGKNDNDPLPGAYILLVGNQNVGTMTDTDGHFEMNDERIILNQSKIKISVMSFKDTEVDVTSENLGTISLEPDNEMLNALVVTDCKINKNVDTVEYDKVTQKCVVKSCTNGYQPEGENCVCNEPEYKVQNGQCVLNMTNKTCKSNDPNADSAKYDKDDNCVIQSCKNGYQRDAKNNKCTCEASKYGLVDGQCVKSGAECDVKNVANATKGEYDFDKQTNKMICTIKKCDKGYLPNEDGTACEQSSGDCTAAQIQAIEHATAGTLNKKRECVPTECETGYKPNSKTRACDKEDPKLSPEDQANKIADLQKNYDDMKAKEKSGASRAAGAIGIGATGFGGMELASAIAEQNADADAERDMAAYLATFVCDFGAGRNIKGGATNIELPGANALLPLRQEYVTLAARLKTQKEALDLLPGIESEEIMDKATMGLYDNESIGKTSGQNTSLYRALTDANSADAAEWAKQKSDTKTQLNVGIGLVAGGIVGSAAINLIGNKNAPKENSAEINAEYAKKLQEIVAQTATAAAQLKPDKKCSDFTGATGDYPTCTCRGRDKNKQYFSVEEGCVTCEGDLVAVDGVCKCPADKPVQGGDANNKCSKQTDGCKLSGYAKMSECKCIDNATADATNECKCNYGYTYKDNACVQYEQPVVFDTSTAFAQFSLDTDVTFKSGSAEIDQQKASDLIAEFGSKLNAEKNKSTAIANAIDQQNYCILVVGHTDSQPYSGNNQTLSEKRAQTIADILVKQGKQDKQKISTSGVGDFYCEPKDRKANANCRKVEIILMDGDCQQQETSKK